MEDSLTTSLKDLPESEAVAEAPAEKPKREPIDWKAITASPAFVPGVALAVGVFAAFWYMILNLPKLWLGEDGYYSHGVLVPIISGYVIYRWWPRLKSIPVKPAYLAAIPLLGILWVTRAATINEIDSLTSVCLIAALIFGTAFIAGWRWMFALSLPIVYLVFALPIWTTAINLYTNPLQVYSTKVAYKMLELTQFAPIRGGDGGNIIYLNGFTLDVGVPCSGLQARHGAWPLLRPFSCLSEIFGGGAIS